MKKNTFNKNNLLENITDVYIFFLIILFPIMVDETGFFHILEYKWNVYTSITSVYLLVSIIFVGYYLFIKKDNILKKIKFGIVQKLALFFFFINVISCFISPYYSSYDLFVGVGRGEGLIVTSLYIFSFIFVSLFGKFKRRYITYFAISSLLLNTIAVLQYVGFNPFNMYQDGIGTHNVSFMTTIGNVDFISAMYCILLSVSFAALLFLDDLKKYEKVLHLLSIYLGIFILGIIDVLSGKVAFFGIVVILSPFILLNNKRLSNFIVIAATVLMSYCTNLILNPEYHYSSGELGLYFQFNYIVVLYIVVCLLLLYVAKLVRTVDYDLSSNKKIVKRFYLGILACGFLGLVAIYFINFKAGFLYEIHEILHGNFDDNFGTYRIFLWKRTLKIYPDFPILGSGPDTFAIRFMARFTEDIARIGPLTINDTAANVYLTMLINLGIVGLASYLLFIGKQVVDGIKKMNKYSKVLLVAIICFLIQDFFNLWLVIVTPVFWILLALHYLSLNKD